MKRCKNGKVKFRTEKEANRARMYILSHDPSAGMLDLLPYICPKCGFFHVGHRSKYIHAMARDTTNPEAASSERKHSARG